MQPSSSESAGDLLASEATIPTHVVRREFAAETVVLNLKTGKYHGLNPVAGKMLEELDRPGTVDEAAKRLSEDFNVPVADIREDLLQLCRQMLERELIEVSPPESE